MKRIFYTFVFVLFTAIMIAQTAPDFTVTDTHGNEHSLYADYLDQNKVVVLDLFFVDCPPCQDLAPFMQAYWEELQAANAPVQFLSLTSMESDNDAKVLGFEEQFGLTFPAASADGGSVEAQQPYTTNEFGEFFGYPTLVVISPDRSVQFDPWGNTQEETISLLDGYVQNALATISSTNELEKVVDMDIYPIPARDYITIDLKTFNAEKTLEVYNSTGALIQTIKTNALQETITIDKWSVGNYIIIANDGDTFAKQQFSVIR